MQRYTYVPIVTFNDPSGASYCPVLFWVKLSLTRRHAVGPPFTAPAREAGSAAERSVLLNVRWGSRYSRWSTDLLTASSNHFC